MLDVTGFSHILSRKLVLKSVGDREQLDAMREEEKLEHLMGIIPCSHYSRN